MIHIGQGATVYLASQDKPEVGHITNVNFNPTNTGRVGLPDTLRPLDIYGIVTVTLDGPRSPIEAGQPAVVVAPIGVQGLLTSIPALAWTHTVLRALVSHLSPDAGPEGV
jgi:hypothetical protein